MASTRAPRRRAKNALHERGPEGNRIPLMRPYPCAARHRERRAGGGRNVTFPARQYAVNGERRSFALLRPIVDTTAQNKVRELVLDAFAEYEERAVAVGE